MDSKVTTLPPGAELDRAVAEKVMGWNTQGGPSLPRVPEGP